MFAPISISTDITSKDAPLASPSVPRAATLRRVNSGVASPDKTGAVISSKPPLYLSPSGGSELRRVKSVIGSSSKPAAMATPGSTSYVPPLAANTSLRWVKSVVPGAANVSNRRESTPMNYSTITSHKPPPLSLAPLALTAVRSFAACGSDEFLQLPSTDDIMSPLDVEPTSSFTMNESDSMHNHTSEYTRQNNLGAVSNNNSPALSSVTTECDYDTNPTKLYLAVQNKKWDLVLERCAHQPNEASTWVSRKESDGNTLRWRLLPIHAAIVFEAPPEVIGALLNAFAYGAQCKDDQGKLPIHLCFRRNCDEEVVAQLLMAYPQSANVQDDKGRTPSILARKCPQSEMYIRLLENICGDDNSASRLLVNTSTENTFNANTPHLPSSAARPPRVPTTTSAQRKVLGSPSSTNQSQPRMDQELMEKLNRRRQQVDSMRSIEVSQNHAPSSMNCEDATDEEGMEVEYDVDKMFPTEVILESPSQDDDDDAALLQRFRSQRVKRDSLDLTDSQSRAPSNRGLNINCGGDSHEGGCNRSIVDMAPPSLRDQIRDRIERRKKGNFDQKVATAGSRNDDESSSHCSAQSRCIDNKGSLKDFLHQRHVREGGTPASHCEESITITSSICNSTSDGSDGSRSIGSLGQYFNIKKSEAWECTLETTEEERDEMPAVHSKVSLSDTGKATQDSVSSDTTPKKNNAMLPTNQHGHGHDMTQFAETEIASPQQDSPIHVSKEKNTMSFDRLVENEVEDYFPKKDRTQQVEIAIEPKRRNPGKPHVRDDESCEQSVAFSRDNDAEKSSLKFWQLKSPEKELELYASTSLLTASTAEITEMQSGSYEDSSLNEVYTSCINHVKKGVVPSDSKKIDPLAEDLSTPKLLMRLDKLKNDNNSFFISPVAADIGITSTEDELATPNLMKKAERFFSSSADNDFENRSNPSSPTSGVETAIQRASPSSSSSSFTQSKFDRIMAKYESMTFNKSDNSSRIADEESASVEATSEIGFSEAPPQTSMERNPRYLRDSGSYAINYAMNGDPNFSKAIPIRPHQEQSLEYNQSPVSGLKIQPSHSEDSTGSYKNPPQQQQPKEFNHPPVSAMSLQSTHSQDSADFYMTIPQQGSMDSDAVSTLSRTTGYTTIGSVSISTENSAVIESYVQSVVHNILAHEVDSASSMKKELEAALKSKMKLEARVKKLVKRSDEQSIQLRKARKAKQVTREKFNREMEIHLTRKASELKSCIEVALNQAEESKRRALELAQRDKEEEVALLRCQLEAVKANGVPVDESLQSALELVESNQRELRRAAETDAQTAFGMKKNIEQSYISAVGEFDAWSEKQLKKMEAKWESLRDANII